MDKNFETFINKTGFKKEINTSSIEIVLQNIKSKEEWTLYQIGEGLFIKDTEPKFGGYFKMFKNLKEANKKGWRKLLQEKYIVCPDCKGFCNKLYCPRCDNKRKIK